MTFQPSALAYLWGPSPSPESYVFSLTGQSVGALPCERRRAPLDFLSHIPHSWPVDHRARQCTLQACNPPSLTLNSFGTGLQTFKMGYNWMLPALLWLLAGIKVLGEDLSRLQSCESCVSAGYKWSNGQCQSECLMDIACYTDHDLCASLAQDQAIASKYPTCEACSAAGHKWSYADMQRRSGVCGQGCRLPCEPFCPTNFPRCPAGAEACHP